MLPLQGLTLLRAMLFWIYASVGEQNLAPDSAPAGAELSSHLE